MNPRPASGGPLRVVGIDPGSRVTGFGILDVRGRDLSYVASGCVRTLAGSHIERLEEIFSSLSELFRDHAPGELALEKVFVARNADSALKLGQARATALCAALGVVPAAAIYEYTPRAVKQATVGYGAAGKEQVQHMVKQLLGLEGRIAEDAADALAVAVCHAHSRQSLLLQQAALAPGGRA